MAQVGEGLHVSRQPRPRCIHCNPLVAAVKMGASGGNQFPIHNHLTYMNGQIFLGTLRVFESHIESRNTLPSNQTDTITSNADCGVLRVFRYDRIHLQIRPNTIGQYFKAEDTYTWVVRHYGD